MVLLICSVCCLLTTACSTICRHDDAVLYLLTHSLWQCYILLFVSVCYCERQWNRAFFSHTGAKTRPLWMSILQLYVFWSRFNNTVVCLTMVSQQKTVTDCMLLSSNTDCRAFDNIDIDVCPMQCMALEWTDIHCVSKKTDPWTFLL